ncbi:MAG: hypothetical protein GY737_09965 [Desulfobacteraceae bacterium]|nr:hypothetical protein [Desulfobacteraceae bacterium]
MPTVFFKRLICIVLITVSASSLGGCTFARQSIAILKSTDHFITHKDDPRVLFEPGAEAYANKIALFFHSAVEQIEKEQFRPFAKPVRVYICASRASFTRMYGADVRAGVLTKLFLSPRIFDYGDDVARRYLTHELSHLHIRDQIGNYKMSRLPFWFKEGLATYVSDGGGAHTATEQQAMDFIKSGNSFVPNETGGFIIQNTPSNWGLRPHMFYRQSMMFMGYLAATNKAGYRQLLLDIENGERFSTALQTAYDKDLDALWNAFLDEINNA